VRHSGGRGGAGGCGPDGWGIQAGGRGGDPGPHRRDLGRGQAGGMAYLYDPEGIARDYINPETLVLCPVTQPHWEAELKGLIEMHVKETGSRRADEILQNWEEERRNFLQVCPKEMLPHLKHPIAPVEDLSAIPAE